MFYPGNRIVKSKPQPKLSGLAARQRAAAIRERIVATVVRRVPQVMVKVTGGGRGMKAIAAHFRYISKNGRLEIEDERGEKMRGKEALHELANPRGIVLPFAMALLVVSAARRLFTALLANHRYHFTTWRWGRVLTWMLAVGVLLKLGLPA